MKSELVLRDRWISLDRFHRVLAVYQILPGPEAHELAVYFGQRAGGRKGALAAGLGFMAPGFLFTVIFAVCYGLFDLSSGSSESVLHAARMGVLGVMAAAFPRLARGFFRLWFLPVVLVFGLAFSVLWMSADRSIVETAPDRPVEAPQNMAFLSSGLKAGLLTFGGAYTAIPVLRNDLVVQRQWISDAEFADGVSVAHLIPAPLIMFGSFAGYRIAGLAACFWITLGIFLPSFAFTLIGHELFERVVDLSFAKQILQGLAAFAVGMMGGTLFCLTRVHLTSSTDVILMFVTLVVVSVIRRGWVPAAMITLSGVCGLVF